VSIAINALGFLSDAYVQWLCGEHETQPTAVDLLVMQAQVFLVVLPLVWATFRELRRYLDHPGTVPQRFFFVVARAVGASLLAWLLHAVADRLPGWAFIAAHVAASSLVLLAIETIVVGVVSLLRARVHPDAVEWD
jgi:hypothetical protein